jgi:hypothetical protein
VEQRSRSLWTWPIALALLAGHAGLLAWSAVRASVTFDEYAHLPAGVAYWKFREFSVHNLSPPLLRMLGAWPAVLAGADPPPASSFRKYDERQRHWIYADAFLRANREHYHRYFVLGRFAMIPISCAGGLIVFIWSRRLYGDVAGLASCALYAICPNILSHASLVGTDAGVAVFLLLAALLWQRFCANPNWKTNVLASLAIAAAILCKFTALLIAPVVIAIAIWGIARERKRWRAIASGLLVAALVVWLCINLMYGYWRTFEPLGSLDLQSSTLRAVQQKLPSWTPVPLPRLFVLGFDAQKYEAELLPPAYLLGEQYRGARWNYYPIALLCKLPVGTIALALVALLLFLRGGIRADEWPLVIVLVIFAVGMTLLARVNVGLRYLLPMLPPMFVLVGRAFSPSPRRGEGWGEGGNLLRRAVNCPDSRPSPRPSPLAGRGRLRAGGLVLVIFAATESLAFTPRFLTFFNLACGGPARGQFILNDSNFDWGQSLLELRSWMDRNNVDRIGLAYFGRVDPGVYGIDYSVLIEGGGEPLVAVSSYYLTGMPHRMPTPDGPTDYVKLDYARKLRARKPLAIVGRTIYIFRRGDVEAAQREHLRRQAAQR